jgi:hypothetical protein
LGVAKRQEAVPPPFTTDARLLVARQISLRKRFLKAVDPNSPGVDARGDSVCSVNVRRPDSSSKAGRRVIHSREQLVFV